MFKKYLLLSLALALILSLSACGGPEHVEEEDEEEVLEITFPDSNLEAAIRAAIGKPEGSILPSDLEGLTSLDASERGITDLTGLEYCTNLTELS